MTASDDSGCAGPTDVCVHQLRSVVLTDRRRGHEPSLENTIENQVAGQPLSAQHEVLRAHVWSDFYPFLRDLVVA